MLDEELRGFSALRPKHANGVWVYSTGNWQPVVATPAHPSPSLGQWYVMLFAFEAADDDGCSVDQYPWQPRIDGPRAWPETLEDTDQRCGSEEPDQPPCFCLDGPHKAQQRCGMTEDRPRSPASRSPDLYWLVRHRVTTSVCASVAALPTATVRLYALNIRHINELVKGE